MFSRFCQIIFIALISTIISSCGSGGKNNTAANETPVKVSASQIVFKSTNGIQLASLAGGVVDPSIKVLAENVTIDNTSNALKSDNLQDALDKEIAVSLQKTLTGQTWNITNKTSDTTYAGTTGMGVVKFNDDGTMTLLSGGFAAIGKVSGSENSFCNIPQTINYELISNDVVYVSASVKSRTDSNAYTEDTVLKIASRTKDKIVVTGTGGCGYVGFERISILTPQNNSTTVNKSTYRPLSHI